MKKIYINKFIKDKIKNLKTIILYNDLSLQIKYIINIFRI